MKITTYFAVALPVAIAAAFTCIGQVAKTPADLNSHAWDILDKAWNQDGSAEKRMVLGSLTNVESDRATAIFLAALRDRDPAIAGDAAGLLSSRRLPQAAPFMIARLATDNDTYMAIRFMGRLRDIRTQAVADAVWKFASQDNEPLTGVAFGVLQAIGTEGVSKLQLILQTGCGPCRETAAFVLVQEDRHDSLNAFKRALSDERPRVRALAAIGLAKSHDYSGRAILRETTDSSDPVLRVLSVLSLFQADGSRDDSGILACLKDASPDVRRITVKEVAHLGNSNLRAMALNFAERDTDASVRSVVVDEESATPTSQHRLAHLLDDSDVLLRLSAAGLALRLNILTEEADRTIKRLSGTMSNQQEAQLLSAISQSGDSARRYKNLIAAALRSSDKGVQVAALSAAVRLGPDSIGEVFQLLDNDDVFVSASAAKALTEISPSQVIPLLVTGTRSQRAHVRVISAGYLLRALELRVRDAAA